MAKIKMSKSMREKKRYLAFVVRSDFYITKKEISLAIWHTLMNLLGEMKVSKLHYRFLEYDGDSRVGIVVCSHKFIGEVIACLSLIGNVNNKRVSIVPLAVSGTIKALRRKVSRRVFQFREVNYNGKWGEKDIKVAQIYNNLIDVEPFDEEICERLREMNMKFVGLVREEVKFKEE